MSGDAQKKFEEFASAIESEENPEKLEQILDSLISFLADHQRDVYLSADQTKVSRPSMIQ